MKPIFGSQKTIPVHSGKTWKFFLMQMWTRVNSTAISFEMSKKLDYSLTENAELMAYLPNRCINFLSDINTIRLQVKVILETFVIEVFSVTVSLSPSSSHILTCTHHISRLLCLTVSQAYHLLHTQGHPSAENQRYTQITTPSTKKLEHRQN